MPTSRTGAEFERLFLARLLMRNAHDAEDVVQEAYLKALRCSRVSAGRPAGPWFLTIARNTAFTWLRDDRSDLPGNHDLTLYGESMAARALVFAARRAGLCLILFALAASAQNRLFVDSSDAELVRALPELGQVQFASAPNLPDGLSGQISAGLADVSLAAQVHEMRLDTASMLWTSSAHTDRFHEDLRVLLQSRFRYLGTAKIDGKDMIAAAFADDKTEQGILWIDTASRRISRVLVDRAETRTDIHFVAGLPAIATLDARKQGQEIHTVFRFSESKTEDAVELLARGAELTHTKPAEALKSLNEAFRLDPERPELRYQRGLAFLAIGDLADAEAELRETLNRLPDCAPAHNYLGIVLFQLGNAKAAAEEFRAAARLAPGDPNAQLNLEETLAAAGGRQAEPTISVDVRQVLVPVVVTDREGHHVTGLTREDFRILEDGTEQKIAAFSVEHAGLTQAAASAGTQPAPARVTAPRTPAASSAPVTKPQARRTYLICLDTLHGAFNNFTAAREALVKLFQQERSEDSQYVMIALGTTAQVVLNTTPDPAAVLAALQSKNFRKIFLDGQQGALKPELERYRRDLNETRENCDLYTKTREMPFEVKCSSGMTRAPQEAQLIADLDRTLTVGFLRQFRFLVTQLARAQDRRTIILLSDGFQIVPGREAYDLLNAFFPDLKGYGLPAVDRMQDEFEPILRLAAMSNITIDTIDTRGLYGQGAFDASTQGSAVTVGPAVDRVDRNMAAGNANTLAEIAETTGGTAFHDNNNLLNGLERAFADGRDYYTIAYVSTNSNLDGKFRSISVQVRRTGAVVNAKRGYWSLAASERPGSEGRGAQ